MRTGEGIWLRAGVLGALVLAGVVAALVIDLPDPGQVRSWLDDGGALAWALLIGGVALVLCAPVPRSLVSVLAGAVLGFGAGLAIALIGGMLGGLVAFGLSRVLGRPAVTRLAGPRLHHADEVFTGRGFVAVLTARLIPVVPFVVVSYGAGLSGIRLGPYVAATALGLVPSTLVQVGVGASTEFVVEHVTTLTLVPAVTVALLLLGAGIWWFRRRARRAGEQQPRPI